MAQARSCDRGHSSRASVKELTRRKDGLIVMKDVCAELPQASAMQEQKGQNYLNVVTQTNSTFMGLVL